MIWVILYFFGMLATMRLFVFMNAKKWPSLGWRGEDTVMCIFFACWWPLSIFLIMSDCMPYISKKGTFTILPFKRWFEKDRNKCK